MLSWSDPEWAATVEQVVWVEGRVARGWLCLPASCTSEARTANRDQSRETGELEVRVALSYPETPSQMHPEATGPFLHKEQDPKHHSLEVSTQTRGRHQGSSLLPQGPSNVYSAWRPLTSCRKDEMVSGHVWEWLLLQAWRAAQHVNKSGLCCQAAPS